MPTTPGNLGYAIALAVGVLAVLGLFGILPYTALVVFGLLLALAVARVT